jgi:putative hydroxymethylpyrimidine transport system ATP-binding protein
MRPGDSLPVRRGIGVRVDRAVTGFEGGCVFRDLAIDLPAGRWTCLLGPSGIGKTTLLRLIAGLLPTEPPTRIEADDGLGLAGRVAYLAQQDMLLPWLSVLDNVLLGRRLRREPVTGPGLERARRILAEVGLGANLADRPATLSGGMRQRAALARTLMEDRPLVLMDEPFSALDAITRLRLQELAATLLAGRTVLLVTHDPLEALRLGHQVLVMSGTPVAMTPALMPGGVPPRAVDSPELLGLQAELLRRLAA